ncbi:Anthocyanidin 3-O-glucosyltransferase [Apostasia shenzhenica]|uniref:Anthocyanidin 3-O-glucosyltransferase n=1 Tax=Apostasia shenzhenica TaxID=1088818 RepID=A0A2I0B0C8_9ASPA|nr:Anthocyanidin 3-O-glucosyltransferase [Apostasia shenzhenica]
MASHESAVAAGNLHVVFVPFVAFGHISPFLHLSGKISAVAGVRVTFLTTPANVPRITSLLPSSHSIFILTVPLPSVPGLDCGAESTADTHPDTAELLKLAVDHMKPQIAAILSDLRPDFVIFDFAQPWIPSIAHPLGIKTLFFSVFSAASTAYLTVPSRRTSAAGNLKRPPTGFPTSTALSAGVPSYQAADFAYLFKNLAVGEHTVYDRVLAGLTGCSAVVAKTCLEMEEPYIRYVEAQLGKPILLAGPVVPELPSGELDHQWAEFLSRFSESSVIFCSFGSETFLSDEAVTELLLGLEMTGMPFLAVLNRLADGDKLPEGFELRVSGRGVVREGWAPQQLILRHRSVGCFVNHGGLSSLTEGVVAGRRLVMIPQKGDQFLNAKLFAGDLGIGVEVEREEEGGGFGRAAVRDAVVKAMEEDDEARGRFEKLRRFLMDAAVQKGFIAEFVEKLRELANGD